MVVGRGRFGRDRPINRTTDQTVPVQTPQQQGNVRQHVASAREVSGNYEYLQAIGEHRGGPSALGHRVLGPSVRAQAKYVHNIIMIL